MGNRWVRRRAVQASRAPRVRAGLVGCVLAMVVVAGCGSSSPDRHSAVTTRPAATVTSTTSTTTDPAMAAVLAAYRAGWAAYEQALGSADPQDPGLGATMVDPLLQRVRANLLGYQHDGIVGRGGVQLAPKVTAVSSATATVLDCMFSTSKLVYANTGKPVPPVTPPEHDGVQSTLILTGGTWEVSQQSVTEGKCPGGS